jgi:hypothetical protein
MMANHGDDGFVPSQFEKLARGVANNNRDLLPRMGLTAREARNHYRDSGLRIPTGFTYAEASIAALPEGSQLAFEAFTRRLTCALFYKEVGHAIPLDYYILSNWNQIVDPRSRQFELLARELFSEIRLTTRTNTNIGNQFGYMWGYRYREVFAYAAQFANSFYFLGCAIAPSLYRGDPGWKQHREDVPI